jgi:PTS system nitrogen regulatory IIA component
MNVVESQNPDYSRQFECHAAGAAAGGTMPRDDRPIAPLARRIGAWLEPVACALDISAIDANAVIRAAADLAATAVPGLDAGVAFRTLWRREQAASTGLGAGIAIPHARIGGLAQPKTFIVRTQQAVDFGAPDGKPVDRFLVILVPALGNPDEHLEMLARLTHATGDVSFRRSLREATDLASLRSTLAEALLWQV